MTAREFITNTFNTDFLRPEELETMIGAMELYASGKLLERNIQCACEDEHKHGETQIMCCNRCGLPAEKFWNKKPNL
jgi:hypothetical protein